MRTGSSAARCSPTEDNPTETQTLEFTRTDTCDVLIGTDVWTRATGRLTRHRARRQVALITNEVVARWYLEPLSLALQARDFHVVPLVIPDGEHEKSIATAVSLIEKMLARGLDRSSLVVGLGGGVIGDLAGFVAATFMRGIPFAFFPTTLLAMVDAAVGGKVAVNLPAGKNLMGTFKQPTLVAIELTTLNTLPLSQLCYGLVEAVKHGAIADSAYFRFIHRGRQAIKSRDLGLIHRLVRRSVNIKKAIVLDDEREAGPRALLNLGHTFGHAIEAIGEYARHSHGEAVALGMLLAVEVSRQLGVLRADYRETLVSLFRDLDLPCELPQEFDGPTLVAQMLRDKKKADDKLHLVLPIAIGKAEIVPVAIADLPRLVETAVAALRNPA